MKERSKCRLRVIWASLFLEEFNLMLAIAGSKVRQWYWTDSIVKFPERGQLDAIVEVT